MSQLTQVRSEAEEAEDDLDGGAGEEGNGEHFPRVAGVAGGEVALHGHLIRASGADEPDKRSDERGHERAFAAGAVKEVNRLPVRGVIGGPPLADAADVTVAVDGQAAIEVQFRQRF